MRCISDLTISELKEISKLMGTDGLWGLKDNNAEIVKDKYQLESVVAGKAITLLLSGRGHLNFLTEVEKYHGSDFKFSDLSLAHMYTQGNERLPVKIAEYAYYLGIRMKELREIKANLGLVESDKSCVPA